MIVEKHPKDCGEDLASPSCVRDHEPRRHDWAHECVPKCPFLGLVFVPKLLARFSAFFGVDLATNFRLRKLKPRSFSGG